MTQYVIILSNTAGELDRRTADTVDDIAKAISDIVENTEYFATGDSIRVEESAQ